MCIRFPRSLIAVLLLAACGDDGYGSDPQDAAVDMDITPDASSDCDYSEADDTANEARVGAESTGLVVTTQRKTLCGTFASNHFDGDITVDEDYFTIETSEPVDLLVRIIGNASTIEYSGMDVYSGNNRIGGVTYYGDHAVGELSLPAGTFTVGMFALNTAAIPQPVAYTIELAGDTPTTRCLELSSGGFAEANDGANNTGNNVYNVPDGGAITLTASNADAPEPTMLTLDTTPTRVTGSAADLAMTDQYEDKDAYAFRTNGLINELTVRLTWAGTANLDFMLFEGTALQPEYRNLSPATMGPELRTYSIKPSRDYTLLVGAKAGATFPVAYTATLCGARYEP